MPLTRRDFIGSVVATTVLPRMVALPPPLPLPSSAEIEATIQAVRSALWGWRLRGPVPYHFMTRVRVDSDVRFIRVDYEFTVCRIEPLAPFGSTSVLISGFSVEPSVAGSVFFPTDPNIDPAYVVEMMAESYAIEAAKRLEALA